jgi:transposase, IS30 family
LQPVHLEERERLYALKEQKLSLREIALKLRRSHTTLSRELKKNRRFFAPYIPCHAHRYAKWRIQLQRTTAALKQPEIYDYVLQKLTLKWSPETIAGRLPIDYPGFSIHFETIYRFIYRDSQRGYYLWTYLTHARKKRMKRSGRRVKACGKIPDADSIDLRPVEAQERKYVGHWETDNVIGKRADATVLSTTVERVTRYTMLSKLTKTAEAKQYALVKRLWYFPTHLRKTLTTDNGLENANHKEIAESLSMPMYFCHAYHSWEKGTVENMNGRIRRYIPKGKSIDTLTNREITAVENALNHTPRKCLGFRTPDEVMVQALRMRKQTKLWRLIDGVDGEKTEVAASLGVIE